MIFFKKSVIIIEVIISKHPDKDSNARLNMNILDSYSYMKIESEWDLNR